MRSLAAVLVLLAWSATAPAAADPLEATALDGPFNDLTQRCAPCTTTARLTSVGGAMREARVIFAGDASVAPTPSNQLRHWLAIRTVRGWYLQALGFSGVICGGRAQSLVSLSASGLAATDVLGDHTREVVLDVDSGVSGGGSQIRDQHRYVCAIGAGGAPRCASLFVRRNAAHADDSWDYTLAISRAGIAHLGKDSYGHADLELTLSFP